MSPLPPTVSVKVQVPTVVFIVPLPLLTKRTGAANCFQSPLSPQLVNLLFWTVTVCVPFALWLKFTGTCAPVKEQLSMTTLPSALE